LLPDGAYGRLFHRAAIIPTRAREDPPLTTPETHLAIDRRLCGEPVELAVGEATVAWTALAMAREEERA
jgi:hypothetical protein